MSDETIKITGWITYFVFGVFVAVRWRIVSSGRFSLADLIALPVPAMFWPIFLITVLNKVTLWSRKESTTYKDVP